MALVRHSVMLLGHHHHWLVVLGHIGAQEEAFDKLLAHG